MNVTKTMANEIDEGFVKVANRSKRNKRKKTPSLQAALLTYEDINKTSPEIRTSIFSQRNELKDSQYWKEAQKCLDTSGIRTLGISTLVCYGIGKFGSNSSSRYQLVLLSFLQELLEIGNDQVYFSDPVLRPNEIQYLTEEGFKCIPNDECLWRVTCPTLFYMPHCGKAMYNNLLWANWAPEQLLMVALMGNSFSAIVTRTPSSILKSDAPYIPEAMRIASEFALRNCFDDTTVFNEFSLHVFKANSFTHTSDDFWLAKRPKYSENADIILAATVSSDTTSEQQSKLHL